MGGGGGGGGKGSKTAARENQVAVAAADKHNEIIASAPSLRSLYLFCSAPPSSNETGDGFW